MGIFQQFPYSNFHEMNLDQIIKIMREMQDEWDATKTEWSSYKDFIDNYFNTLDVSDEVLSAMRIFAVDGTLNNILDPVIVSEVVEWLEANITPTTPIIDKSLSIENASAEALTTGANIKALTGMELIHPFVSIENSYFDYNDGLIKNNTNYKRTDLIPINPLFCEIILTSTNAGEWDDRYNCWYDADGSFISNFRYPRPDGTSILDPPVNASFMGISCRKEVNITIDIKYKSKIETFELNNKNSLRHDNNIEKYSASILTGKDFEQGALTPEGKDNPDIEGQQGRMRTIGFIPVEENTLYILSALEFPRIQFAVSFFTSNKPNSKRFDTTDWIDTFFSDFGVFVTPANTKYIRITLKRGVSPITPEYLKDFVITLYKSSGNLCATDNINYGYGVIVANSGDLNRSANGWIYSQPLTDGFINFTSGISGVIKLYRNDTYVGKINTSNEIDQVAGNWQTFTGIVNVSDILTKYNATHLIFSAQNHRTPFTANNYKELSKQIGYYVAASDIDSYAKDSAFDYNSFIKIPVTIESELIKLLGYQAFDIKDNIIYSTDGNALYEQNIVTNETTTTALGLGHGNTLQVGDNNNIFVSGWDDNTVYEIDLTTRNITHTYVLPVNGYTSVAIDEANSLMYIIYRASYPDTVAPYELITYNYVTNTIITRKTIDSFKGMQDCVFANNRILAICGFGDGSAELKVYDTNGDIITKYDIGILKDQEPEGICFNKSTNEIWFSTVSALVYSIKI